MIRVPIGNHRSMRTEVRAVAPDANPYLSMYSIFKTGIDGEISDAEGLRAGGRYLPDNIYKAIADFRASDWIAQILGADVQGSGGVGSSVVQIAKILGADVRGRYADLKEAAADRCPKQLGTIVKGSEVQFHHAVYNQSLWNLF
jgi:glutamine synthetase